MGHIALKRRRFLQPSGSGSGNDPKMVRGRLVGMNLAITGEDPGRIKCFVSEGHHRAAEPTPAQTGAKDTFPPPGGLVEKPDKGIQFGNTIFEKQTTAFVGSEKDFPKTPDVGVDEARHTIAYPEVFLDDMAGAFLQHGMVVQRFKMLRRCMGEMVESAVNALSQQPESLAAFLMAFRVPGIDKIVLAVGVEDMEAQPAGQGDRGKACRGAINTNKMVFLTEARDGLVENATGNADKLIFRPLGKKNFFLHGEIRSGQGGNRFQRRKFHGGAAAETRTDGKIAGEEQVQAPFRKGPSLLPKNFENSERVIRPGGLPLPGVPQVHLSLKIGPAAAHKPELSVLSRSGSDTNLAVESYPENLAAVVIRMVTDKFDPAWRRGHDLGPGSKRLLEFPQERLFIHRADFDGPIMA